MLANSVSGQNGVRKNYNRVGVLGTARAAHPSPNIFWEHTAVFSVVTYGQVGKYNVLRRKGSIDVYDAFLQRRKSLSMLYNSCKNIFHSTRLYENLNSVTTLCDQVA